MAINVPIVSDWNDKGLRNASKDIESFSKRAKRQFDGLADAGRKIALGVAAGAVGAIAAGKQLVAASEAASTSNNRIRQVATSMGLFGDQVDSVSARLVDYANKTARATGVDQNQIKATQAKLLTFKNLAATAGEVGGAFDRATAAAVDLAAAGFGEASSNAVQLGKALQDPIKGITALSRSGVTFTNTEQELIKTLVESGKIADAQNMILGALETQVGGTAVATANASNQMRVAFTQLQERIGMKLLPIFQRFAAFIVDRLYPAIERFTNFAWRRLVDAFQSARPFFQRIADIFNNYLRPAFERLVEFMRNNEDVVKAFFAVLAGAAAIAMLAALAAALGKLLTPFGLIVIAIAAVVAAFVWAYQNVEWFRNAVDAIGRWFRDEFPKYWWAFANVLYKVWDWLWAAAIGIARWFRDTFLNEDSKWRHAIELAWRITWNSIKRLVEGVFNIIVTVVQGFVKIFQGIWNVFMGVITLDWSRAWEGIKQIFSGVVEILKAILMTLILPFQVLWAGFGEIITLLWRNTWAAIQIAFGTVAGAIRSAVQVFIDTIRNIISIGGTAILGAWRIVTSGIEWLWDNTAGRIISAVQNIINAVRTAIDSIKSLGNVPVPNPISGITGAIGGIVGGIRGILPFADGGLVTRPTLGLIGEAGPEVVVPLDRIGQMGGTVNVYVQGSVITEKDLVEQIRIGLIRSQRSGRPLVA